MNERDTENPPPAPTLAPPPPITQPPPPVQANPQTELILAKLGTFEKTLVTMADSIIALTSAVHENSADVRQACGVANLAGNMVKDVAERLEQTIEELRVSSEILGGVKEASGSAIDMASKAIDLAEKATKLAAGTYNLAHQIAEHLNLELVDEADSTPALELLARR